MCVTRGKLIKNQPEVLNWRNSAARRAFLELYLLLCKVALDQGAHDLLGGFGGADVGDDEAAVGFLCVADPTWKEDHPQIQLKNKKQTFTLPILPKPQVK